MIISFTNVIGAIQSLVKRVITDNLKMWLGFETSSIGVDKQITPDKSGNNNVGELFTGKALEFDGVNNEIDVSGFTMSGTSATFAFWIYPSDTSYQFIMDNKLASGNTDRTILALFQSGSDPQKFAFFNYGFKQFGTPTQNQWQRVVFRVNSTTVECYVDGVQSGTTQNLTLPIDLSASVTANIASKSGSTSASNFDGKLSDFQVYNAYWSTDDIAYDYANPQNLVTDRSGTSITLSNLKAYWAMSEGKGSTAYDSSGEGNNGTITGATYDVAQPRIPQLGMMNYSNGAVASLVPVIPNPNNTSQDILGNAVRDRLNSFNLDGVGYASVANNSSIKPTNALSIECWIKTSDVSVVSKYISDADLGATRFFLMQVGSKARFKIATTEIDSAANLTDNTWHYIAGTWDGSTMTLYVDERTPVTASKSGAITYDSDDLFIGSRLGLNEKFNGLISDVRLYDRALTSDEVENNYNAGLSAHS